MPAVNVPPIMPLRESTVSNILNAKDHFQVLGLPQKRCGGAELRKAYKMTALKVHPDKCEDDRALDAFRRLQEAFSVLSDPSLHARYAQTLAAAKSMAAARSAASRARERNMAYAARSRMSKEELERQVKEMLARQSRTRPMSAGAQRAAEERVQKEKDRVARLQAEAERRQREATERREAQQKALDSARQRQDSARRRATPRASDAFEVDPAAQRAAEERARKRAASMAMLGAAMKWEVDPITGELVQQRRPNTFQASESAGGGVRAGTNDDGQAAADGSGTARSSQGSGGGGGTETPRSRGNSTPRTPRTPRSRGSTPRRPSTARESQQMSPFGDLKTLKRAQTERILRRPSSARSTSSTPRSQYLPRFMQKAQDRAKNTSAVVVQV
jgi:curved DNA-binding protein CbpA